MNGITILNSLHSGDEPAEITAKAKTERVIVDIGGFELYLSDADATNLANQIIRVLTEREVAANG